MLEWWQRETHRWEVYSIQCCIPLISQNTAVAWKRDQAIVAWKHVFLFHLICKHWLYRVRILQSSAWSSEAKSKDKALWKKDASEFSISLLYQAGALPRVCVVYNDHFLIYSRFSMGMKTMVLVDMT